MACPDVSQRQERTLSVSYLLYISLMMNDELMSQVVLTRLYFSSPLLLSHLGVIPVTAADFVYNTAPSSFTLASFHSHDIETISQVSRIPSKLSLSFAHPDASAHQLRQQVKHCLSSFKTRDLREHLKFHINNSRHLRARYKVQTPHFAHILLASLQ